VLAGSALLAVLLSGGMAFGEVESQEELPPVQIPATGMKSGRLTDKGEKSAEISGKDYAFHPKIVFGDDEERPLEWKDFKRSDEVQYHLKQERIDLLILVRPK
jgi:hypothetical protein